MREALLLLTLIHRFTPALMLQRPVGKQNVHGRGAYKLTEEDAREPKVSP